MQAQLPPAGVRSLEAVPPVDAGEALAAHEAGRLQFLGSHAYLADAKAFAVFLAPLRKKRWFVYAKRPCRPPWPRYRQKFLKRPGASFV